MLQALLQLSADLLFEGLSATAVGRKTSSRRRAARAAFGIASGISTLPNLISSCVLHSQKPSDKAVALTLESIACEAIS